MYIFVFFSQNMIFLVMLECQLQLHLMDTETGNPRLTTDRVCTEKPFKIHILFTNLFTTAKNPV